MFSRAFRLRRIDAPGRIFIMTPNLLQAQKEKTG
jgi:hypothetical protein